MCDQVNDAHLLEQCCAGNIQFNDCKDYRQSVYVVEYVLAVLHDLFMWDHKSL